MDPEKKGTADKSTDPRQDCNLYIYLGLDSIFSLNLNHLLSSDYKLKPELKKVFTLPNTVSKYPLKGLYVMDSKLHCLSGFDKKPFQNKLFSFKIPSFNLVHTTCNTSYSTPYDYISRPILFTISNKVYALECTPFRYLRYHQPLFNFFEPESGAWKFLPSPQTPCFDKLIVFQNKVLLQIFDEDFIFDANAKLPIGKKNAKLPIWKKITDKFFPRICAALEHRDFLFVLTKKPHKLFLYDLASFGEEDCFSFELDIWKDRPHICNLCIRWASLSLIGNNRICLVCISKYKIHIYVIRFLQIFFFAELEAYQVHDIPESIKSSVIPHCSTFFWGPDMNRHEREENPTVSQHHHIKADQIEENSMDQNQADQIEETSMDHNQADQIEENSMDYNQDPYLYIYLGFGALLSLNINELCKKNQPSLETKLDLELVFSHHNRGKEFPIGMGLFIMDSKLHFFGGENLEDYEDGTSLEDDKFLEFSKFVGLKKKVRPKYGKCWYKKASVSSDKDINKKKVELDDEWFNKKFYSFNLPCFTSYNPPLPSHSGCKLRPLVFTISGKYYALSTRTISISLSSFEQVDEGKLKLFEVFEPENNEWRHLELPPVLCKEILHNTLDIDGHCVFGDKMLLQTVTRDYVFDSDSGDWIVNAKWYPSIYTAVEYGEVLFVLSSYHPIELLVYELASFGEKDPTFVKLDMNKKDIEFFEHSTILGASLNRVDHNRISLVLMTMTDIHVVVFNVEVPIAVIEARGKFDVPKYCIYDIQPLSTFLTYLDAKAASPSEEKYSTVSQRDMSKWSAFKDHLNTWADDKYGVHRSDMPCCSSDGSDMPRSSSDGSDVPSIYSDGSDVPSICSDGSDVPSICSDGSDVPSICSDGSGANDDDSVLE